MRGQSLLLLLAALVGCGSTAASAPQTPLLAPIALAGDVAAQWRAQLAASPTYHGRFHIAYATSASRVDGTIASDPAHRKLRVATDERYESGSDRYHRWVELVTDGVRARLSGRNEEGAHHTSVATLPPVRDPAAPFGDVPNGAAELTFGGDLRQSLLDCLDHATLMPSGPRQWRITRPVEHAVDDALRRGDWLQLDGATPHVVNRCDGAVMLADDRGVLHGIRFPYGSTLTFELFAGVDASELVIAPETVVGARSMDADLARERARVDALIADPGFRDRLVQASSR